MINKLQERYSLQTLGATSCVGVISSEGQTCDSPLF